MNPEENESFKDYINSINFIVPQDIPSDQEKNSYANLKYGNPNEIRKRSDDNDSGRDYSSLNLFSDTNKTSDNASDTLTNELKKEKNDKKEIKIKDISIDSNKSDKESKRFGQHTNFSFYESCYREIVFQIFNYHEMYFFSYSISKKELDEIKKEQEQKEGGDKEKLSEKNKEINKKNIAKKNNKAKTKNIKITKASDKKSEETHEKNETIQIKKKGAKNTDAEENEEKKEEEKKEEKAKKEEEEKKEEEVNKEEDKKEEEEKKEIEVKKEKEIKVKEIKEGEVKKEKEKKVKNKKEGEVNNALNEKKKEKDKNNIQEEEKDKTKKENNKEKCLLGDIDFLLPDLSPKELEKVLKKREFVPFIFYGNINFNKNSDLVGEVKENILTGDKKHIKQFKKYRQIFELCQKSEYMNKKFGLKKENQKIIVYIFNHNYQDYLKRMLLYKPHFKNFYESNDSFKASRFLEFYEKNYIKEGDKAEPKRDLIYEIIHSNCPYIFMFIQDISTSYKSSNPMNGEIKKIQSSIKLIQEDIREMKDVVKDMKSSINKMIIFLIIFIIIIIIIFMKQ